MSKKEIFLIFGLCCYTGLADGIVDSNYGFQLMRENSSVEISTPRDEFIGKQYYFTSSYIRLWKIICKPDGSIDINATTNEKNLWSSLTQKIKIIEAVEDRYYKIEIFGEKSYFLIKKVDVQNGCKEVNHPKLVLSEGVIIMPLKYSFPKHLWDANANLGAVVGFARQLSDKFNNWHLGAYLGVSATSNSGVSISENMSALPATYSCSFNIVVTYKELQMYFGIGADYLGGSITTLSNYGNSFLGVGIGKSIFK